MNYGDYMYCCLYSERLVITFFTNVNFLLRLLPILYKKGKISKHRFKTFTNGYIVAHQISLNCDKTEIIIFFQRHGSRTTNKNEIYGIYPLKSIKYLGIYIDETLNLSLGDIDSGGSRIFFGSGGKSANADSVFLLI